MIVAHPRTRQIGHTLPESTTLPWDTVEKPFRHFVLTIDPGSATLGRKSLVFSNFEVIDPENPAPTANTVAKASLLAGALVKKEVGDYGSPTSKPSFDIDLKEQTWLLIELDPAVNWRFSPEFPAITTKEELKAYVKNGVTIDGFNIQLRYLYLDRSKDVIVDDKIPPKNVVCRHVIFGVAHRRDYEQHQFNFAVEFYQALTGGVPADAIPLIVDPTVPEDGHEEFPP